MSMEEPERGIRLVVVEAYEPGPTHLVVRAREQINDPVEDVLTQSLYVRKPTFIQFGDRLLYYKSVSEFFLDRGPKLQYKVHTDPFPKEVLAQLILDCSLLDTTFLGEDGDV